MLGRRSENPKVGGRSTGVGRAIRGARRPFCPLPAGASPPSTASSGGHDAVPCLAGRSSRSRCRSHSLAMFDAGKHHRTISPGGGESCWRTSSARLISIQMPIYVGVQPPDIITTNYPRATPTPSDPSPRPRLSAGGSVLVSKKPRARQGTLSKSFYSSDLTPFSAPGERGCRPEICTYPGSVT